MRSCRAQLTIRRSLGDSVCLDVLVREEEKRLAGKYPRNKLRNKFERISSYLPGILDTNGQLPQHPESEVHELDCTLF